MTEKQLREPGYYWVKYTNEWIICEYLDGEWFFINTSGSSDDSAFDEIGENRIERNGDFVSHGLGYTPDQL